MTRRALIIRSGYDPVAGVHNAAECIGQVLHLRGFELVRCEGPAATRRGILAAYDDLIARAQPDDAIVIYYAGHGGLATNRSYSPADRLPPFVQHICPTDFAETRDDDFRGICALELSLKLAALTRQTANATVILECCYAAQMSREATGDPAPVVQPKLTRVGLTRHLEEVRELARSLDMQPGTVNPRAVRVAAAGQAQLARQVSLPGDEALGALGITLSRRSEWIGALTLGLVQILTEIGDAAVPWRSIAPALRARLRVQRPEIEGPISRVPFSLATVDDASFAVRLDRDGAVIEAGRLLGVSPGDVYHVVAAAAPAGDPAARVATLTIDEVSATSARASRVAWAGAPRALPPYPVAVAGSLAPERHAVRIVAGDPERDAVLAALQRSEQLRAATEVDGPDVLGELRVTGGQLAVHDRLGPLFPPAPYPDRLADAVLDLTNLSIEQRLRRVAEDGGIASSAVTVELGRLGQEGGAFQPMARHGEPMGLADSFAVRLANTTDSTLYANVFNIGLQRRIALLSAAWVSGVPVTKGTPVHVGDSTSHDLRGIGLVWPPGLAPDRPRRDTVMVVVTPQPVDLRALESQSHLGQARDARSPLHTLLAQLAPGTPRGGSGSARYAIVWRDYLLYPIDRSLDVGIPEIDVSPLAAAVVQPGGATTLRIRCEAIERRSDATRLDVLVVARSAELPVRAVTYFPGEPGDPELWRGVARGPVDVYAFTSAVGSDRRSLAELLRAVPADRVISPLRAPPDDPAADLAGGSSLALAAMARAALAKADPAVATALRGSFGAAAAGAAPYRASAIAFTLAIDAVAADR